MHTHAEKRIVPHTAKQMFDLVIAVDKYPEFLPWCVGVRVTEKGSEHVIADVAVGYKMLRETFTSKVTYKSPTTVDVKYVRGPFRYLNNHWRFKNVGKGRCEIDFYVDFAFKSSVFQQTMFFFFNEAVKIMIEAFEKRAKEVYG